MRIKGKNICSQYKGDSCNTYGVPGLEWPALKRSEYPYSLETFGLGLNHLQLGWFKEIPGTDSAAAAVFQPC